MTPLFLFRLCLDLLAVSLLLAAMAYNWSGNALHEIMGTAMFLLLVSHNIFNRRWYGTIKKGRHEARGVVTKVVNLSLLVTMLSLLVTSVIISKTVLGFLSLSSTFTVRQLHTTVAYLAMLIASVHLGLHWTIFTGVVRTRLGIVSKGIALTTSLRVLALLGAAFGVYSLFEVKVGQKLLMQQSFDFGDLQTATLPYIVHHVAIIWLGACVGHYGLTMVRRRGHR